MVEQPDGALVMELLSRIITIHEIRLYRATTLHDQKMMSDEDFETYELNLLEAKLRKAMLK